jgi:hypothetical protein
VVAQLTYRSATSWSIAVNVPTVQWSPHIALSNFRLSADQNTESASLLSFSGDFIIGSATVSIMGFYTDASNWSMNGKTAELVLSTGLTVTKADLVLDNTAGSITVNAEGLLHFGGEILLASINYTDGDNWSITATGAFSIFGLSGAVSGGVLSESAGVLSGSFTASLSGSLFGVVFAGSATLRLAADGSVSFDASGSATIGGVELAAVIEYVDGDNWSVTAGENWIRSVAGSVTFQGSFAFSFTIGGATFTGQGTAVSQADGSTIYSDMAGSVTFTRGGQTYSLAVTGGSYTDATHWSFTVSGALLINGFDLVVSGTMSEDGSSEWTLVLNDSRAVFTSGGSTFGLSGLSGMLRRTDGGLELSDLAGTLFLASSGDEPGVCTVGSVAPCLFLSVSDGVVVSATDWSFTVDAGSSALLGRVLLGLSGRFCSGPSCDADPETSTNTSVMLRDLVVSVAFGDLVVELSGSMVFTDADNWELTGTVGSLALSSQITLTDLTVVLQSEEGTVSGTVSGSIALALDAVTFAGTAVVGLDAEGVMTFEGSGQLTVRAMVLNASII